MDFKISKTTAAEADQYLLECFEEHYFIDELISNDFSIMLGRKGSGKTAIARYLKSRYKKHGLDFSTRISISELSGSFQKDENPVGTILFFILTKVVQELLSMKFIDKNKKNYWIDFLNQNGLQDIENYKMFIEWKKKNNMGISLGLFNSKANTGFTKSYEKTKISNNTGTLFGYLEKSIKSSKKIIIFIDDVSDYLDRSDPVKIKDDLTIIRDVLLSLDRINCSIIEARKKLRFVSCLRDDVFENMEGSNLNKLESNSLELTCSEKSFCKLLIKRLPFYQKNIRTYLNICKN